MAGLRCGEVSRAAFDTVLGPKGTFAYERATSRPSRTRCTTQASGYTAAIDGRNNGDLAPLTIRGGDVTACDHELSIAHQILHGGIDRRLRIELRHRELFRLARLRGDARRAADVIGIPFYVWDLSDRFHEDVVEDFMDEYAAGRTPNPCLRCNEKIKFAAVLDRALALGFDAVELHVNGIVRVVVPLRLAAQPQPVGRARLGGEHHVEGLGRRRGAQGEDQGGGRQQGLAEHR